MICRFCDTELIYDYEIAKGICVYHLLKRKRRALIFDIKDRKQHKNKFPLFISPEEKREQEMWQREADPWLYDQEIKPGWWWYDTNGRY